MKTIIFDFDGTLTEKHKNVWKFLWQELGFDTSKNSAYATLYTLFVRNKITHQKWCDLTCYFFKKKAMKKDVIQKAIENTPLLPGCLELLKYLKQNDYDIHIVSGCVKEVIESCLGSASNCISKINGNEILFNENKVISYIKGTPYDYEGKAVYVQKLMQENNLSPSDILFVGNADNDEFVHKTGCHTLCVNGETSNYTNKTIWNNSAEINNLTNLIPLIEEIFNKQEEK